MACGLWKPDGFPGNGVPGLCHREFRLSTSNPCLLWSVTLCPCEIHIQEMQCHQMVSKLFLDCIFTGCSSLSHHFPIRKMSLLCSTF